MVTKNPNNFDEALIQDAIFRGMFMMDDFWNKDKKYMVILLSRSPASWPEQSSTGTRCARPEARHRRNRNLHYICSAAHRFTDRT